MSGVRARLGLDRLNASLAGMAVVNLATSFLFNWYLLGRLGASRESDALFAALIVPQSVSMVLTAVTVKVLVPYFSTPGPWRRGPEAWGVFQGVGLLTVPAAAVLSLSARAWVPWLVPGFSPAALALTARLTGILLWGVPLDAMACVAVSVCQARRRFYLAEAAPFGASLAAFAVLLAAVPRLGAAGYAWATLVKSLLPLFVLAAALGSYGPPRLRGLLPGDVWRRMTVLTGGSLLYKVNYLVDRVLSALAPAGGLSLYHVGQQFYSAGEQVLNRAVSGPALPRMSERAHAGDAEGFRRVYRRSLVQIAALAAAGFVVLATAGLPALRLLFAGGRVTAADTRFLWWILLSLGGQMFSPVVLVMANRYYARGNASTPTWISVVGVPAGLCLRVIGFARWGILGLCAATSAYYAFLWALYVTIFREKGGDHRVVPSQDVA